MVMDMRTTREHKEANTVERNMMLKQWSHPSCAVMSFRSFGLGISYALGSGQVPV
jgi:hypothetical protein